MIRKAATIFIASFVLCCFFSVAACAVEDTVPVEASSIEQRLDYTNTLLEQIFSSIANPIMPLATSTPNYWSTTDISYVVSAFATSSSWIGYDSNGLVIHNVPLINAIANLLSDLTNTNYGVYNRLGTISDSLNNLYSVVSNRTTIDYTGFLRSNGSYTLYGISANSTLGAFTGLGDAVAASFSNVSNTLVGIYNRLSHQGSVVIPYITSSGVSSSVTVSNGQNVSNVVSFVGNALGTTLVRIWERLAPLYHSGIVNIPYVSSNGVSTMLQISDGMPLSNVISYGFNTLGTTGSNTYSLLNAFKSANHTDVTTFAATNHTDLNTINNSVQSFMTAFQKSFQPYSDRIIDRLSVGYSSGTFLTDTVKPFGSYNNAGTFVTPKIFSGGVSYQIRYAFNRDNLDSTTSTGFIQFAPGYYSYSCNVTLSSLLGVSVTSSSGVISFSNVRNLTLTLRDDLPANSSFTLAIIPLSSSVVNDQIGNSLESSFGSSFDQVDKTLSDATTQLDQSENEMYTQLSSDLASIDFNVGSFYDSYILGFDFVNKTFLIIWDNSPALRILITISMMFGLLNLLIGRGARFVQSERRADRPSGGSDD